MKRFLLTGTGLLILAILPNFLAGILRFHAGDRIPFRIHTDQDLAWKLKHNTASFKQYPVRSIGDMSLQPVHSSNILRIDDPFGFSNQTENRSPEILYSGDSFMNDPHTATDEGYQARTNRLLGFNASYNIGNHECGGFRVFNELTNGYFQQKPKLLICEAVERNAWRLFTEGPSELRTRKIKSIPYRLFFSDLILGNNFQHFQQSRLFREPERPKIGTARNTRNGRVWFLNNQRTDFSAYSLKQMADSMSLIHDVLAKQQIQVLFVIAPDKESMYPDLFGQSAIPTLQDSLRIRKIPFIDIYHSLTQLDGNAYFPGDTHWNELAIQRLTDSVVHCYRLLMNPKKEKP